MGVIVVTFKPTPCLNGAPLGRGTSRMLSEFHAYWSAGAFDLRRLVLRAPLISWFEVGMIFRMLMEDFEVVKRNATIFSAVAQ